MNWNPGPHIRHAWEAATTIWGKLALVLFYSFIWLGIVMGLWAIIDPMSQGMECVLDQIAPDDTIVRDSFIMTIRVINTLWIGLFVYADFGGFMTKNVALLAIITVSSFLFMTPLQVNEDCGIATNLWVFNLWIILALVFMVMEDKLGDHGSVSERAPLQH